MKLGSQTSVLGLGLFLLFGSAALAGVQVNDGCSVTDSGNHHIGQFEPEGSNTILDFEDDSSTDDPTRSPDGDHTLHWDTLGGTNCYYNNFPVNPTTASEKWEFIAIYQNEEQVGWIWTMYKKVNGQWVAWESGYAMLP